MEDYKKLLEWYNELGRPSAKQLKAHKEFHNEVKKSTNFLDDGIGRVSFALRMKCIENNITSIPVCPICESDKVKPSDEKFTETCSRKCGGILAAERTKEQYEVWPSMSLDAKNKRSSTNVLRYGDENVMKNDKVRERQKNALIDSIGTDNPSKSEEVCKKRTETFMRKYGKPNPFMVDEFKKKSKQTLMKNYNVDHPMKSPIIMEKRKATNIKKYNVEEVLASGEVREKGNNKHKEIHGVESPKQLNYSEYTRKVLFDPILLQAHYIENNKNATLAASLLDIDKTTYLDYLRKYDIDVYSGSHKTSAGELELLGILQSYGIRVEHSVNSLISPYEIDIFLPDFNVAIEYNGVYHHSMARRTDKQFHKTKTKMCMDMGIRLFHFWEDTFKDKNKRKIMLDTILHSCGILKRDNVDARKCVVVEVKKSDVKWLFDECHIQGSVSGTKYYGLYHDGELVSSMILKKLKGGVWDLVRFASCKNVRGGFSKLLSEFKKSEEWSVIQTFADLSHSYGDLYRINGFELVKWTNPIMWYVKSGKRLHRSNFKKKDLHKKFDNFDEALTENQNMLNNGYQILYDAGLFKFELYNKTCG